MGVHYINIVKFLAYIIFNGARFWIVNAKKKKKASSNIYKT